MKTKYENHLSYNKITDQLRTPHESIPITKQKITRIPNYHNTNYPLMTIIRCEGRLIRKKNNNADRSPFNTEIKQSEHASA